MQSWINTKGFHGKRLYKNLAFALLLFPRLALSQEFHPDAVLRFWGPEGQLLARIQVEIADTPEARARGLMYRRLPREDTGMLFIYPDEAQRVFWMRNTPSSLDMLFADAQGRIRHIAANTKPLSDQRYASLLPVKYVIEIRGGFSARHGIRADCRFTYEEKAP